MRKEDFYRIIEQIYNKYGYINRSLLEDNIDTFNVGWQLSKYNGLKNICKEIGLEYRQKSKLKDEDIKRDLMKIYNEYGYISCDLYEKYGKYSKNAITNHFGGFNNILKELGIPLNTTRMDTKEEIINDFKSFYSKYQTTSSTKYRKCGRYSQSVIERLFGSWSSFIKSLNLKPKNEKIGKEKMISDTIALYNEYGFLSAKLINDNCDFSYQALTYHYTMKEISNIIGVENAFLKSDSSGAAELHNALCLIYGKDNIKKEYYEEWLRNPKTKKIMYIDFYIPDSKLAIEYDGKQHYEFVEFIHRKYKNFYNQVYRDRIKERLLRQHGIETVRFKYNEIINYDTVLGKIKRVTNCR